MSNWISVKDRLPDHSEEVYVIASDGRQYVTLFAYLNKISEDSIMGMNLTKEYLEKVDNYIFCILLDSKILILKNDMVLYWHPKLSLPKELLQ